MEIAGYTIGNLLGRGAFGETFEAVKNGERVALKLIKEEAIQRDVDVKRFEREVRSIQKAVGHNVVKLLDYGKDKLGNETRYFIALEFLEGKNLADAFKDSNYKFNEATLKSILSQIISGLESVHSQNVVHRDLKPANIFLTNDGTIKLLDFGLVKMLDYTTLTAIRGQPIGTPLYIAPEMLQAQNVDFRADFYSLGILIYHLVTNGNYPFVAHTPYELYARVINESPKPPTKFNKELSFDFEDLILNLLSKQPFERFNSHDLLRNAVENTNLEIPKDNKAVPVTTVTNYPKRWFFPFIADGRNRIGKLHKLKWKSSRFHLPSAFFTKI